MNSLLQLAPIAAETLTSRLWRASIEGCVAILVVWTIARLWQSLSPRIVCWLWRLVCVKLLIALLLAKPMVIAVLPPKASQPTAQSASAIGPSGSSPIGDTVQLPPSNRSVALPNNSTETGISWQVMLLLAWSIGVVCLWAISVREWLTIRQMCRSSELITDATLLNIFRTEAARLAIRRLPELRQIQIAVGPLLAGIWRPTVILPTASKAAFNDSELRLMLCHELAHLKRRDLPWNWLPTVVGWLFYFHPLVWLLRRLWFESQEAACDELLLQNQAVRLAEYGRLLLKLSTQWPQSPRASLAAAGVLGAYHNLERRIVAMTHVKTFSRRRLLVAACLLSLSRTLF
ncbi:MAG TPA: M56 family metallopeptidase [Pirellulales bacterium]